MSIRFNALIGASLIAFAVSSVSAQQQFESDPLTDVIIVTGRSAPLATEEEIRPDDGQTTAPDAAALVARVPGAALIDNGTISGQIQYRGLFSDRLLVRINGQQFQSGGPNAMDPPLHYAPMVLVERIDISRGIGPVRDGMGLGGGVNAHIHTIDFSTRSSLKPQAQITATYRSAADAGAIGGVVGISNDTWRTYALGAWEKGKDYRMGGGGSARDTGYGRISYGLGGGFQQNGHQLALEWRRQETRPSGNPPYAMDIDYFHTDFLRATYEGQVGAAALHGDLGYARVTHGMDNYTLRPAPADRTKWRYSMADADTLTAAMSIEWHGVRTGIDHQQIDRHVTISNPNNANFWMTSLNRIDQRRSGLFVEYGQRVGTLRVELGARVDWHASRMADPLVGNAVPMSIAALARNIGARDDRTTDVTWDGVLRLWGDSGSLRPRFTLAHKQRVPNAVERHSWLPTEASGGLADGNIYIGNIAVKPEQAWVAEAGIDIQQGALSWRTSVFYRRIDDYIQGVPAPTTLTAERMIATANGDATPLQFANVDAELYGADMDVGVQFSPALRADAVLSYVRGKRRDIADNLYRIAPLNGRASMTWTGGVMSLTAEAVWAAAQRTISRTNDESPSKGWIIGNLWAEAKVGAWLHLSGGVENIFDRRYADHLSGVNRITGSDVAVGAKMPGAGRSLFVRLSATY